MEETKKTTPKRGYFAAIPRQTSKWTSYSEIKNEKIIKSGEDNLFPQHLIGLYNKSSIHAAAVDAIVEGIIAGGLTANEESFLDKANKKGQTWNDIFDRVSMDYYLHGSFALEVIWNLDRTKIAEVYHIDFSKIRAQEKDRRNYIPGYFICNDWKPFTRTTEKEVQYLPSFDPTKSKEQPNQIFVVNCYRPGQNYYPLPRYNGALKVIELDTETDNFHVNNIKNGLAPSLAIITYTNGTDDELEDTEAMLRANYGGTNNAGSLIYMDVDSPANKPEITPIPQNGADSYYTDVNTMTTQKILTAHRITSPLLLGIQQPGSLGNRSEMIDARILFEHNVIQPLQQDILKQLESLLEINHPGIVLGVHTKTLFDDGTTEEEVVTSAETTEQEDKNINR